jgi:hypothetical protein
MPYYYLYYAIVSTFTVWGAISRDHMIYNYLCNRCQSPLTLWVWIPLRRGVLDTTLRDKVCQWLVAGRCFFQGIPVSSTNKTDCHDITEILLKVVLTTITLTLYSVCFHHALLLFILCHHCSYFRFIARLILIISSVATKFCLATSFFPSMSAISHLWYNTWLKFYHLQSRKLGIWIHRTFGPVNCEKLQDRTRFYRTDNKIIFFFLNNKFILFKCPILIALNLQSQTAISTIRQWHKVSVRVLMGSCSGRVRPKTIKLVFFASLLSMQH